MSRPTESFVQPKDGPVTCCANSPVGSHVVVVERCSNLFTYLYRVQMNRYYCVLNKRTQVVRDRLPVRGAFIESLCVCTSVPTLSWGD